MRSLKLAPGKNYINLYVELAQENVTTMSEEKEEQNTAANDNDCSHTSPISFESRAYEAILTTVNSLHRYVK